MLSRVPRPIRQTARRLLKSAWWAATPWRIPARIALTRERRAEALKSAALTEVKRNATWSPQVVGNNAVERRVLNYVPAKPAHDNAITPGHYELTEANIEYVYVPPRRPIDLKSVTAAMTRKPFFSIVVPLYNTPSDLLKKLIASVEAQWYGNWELILVDDKSPLHHVREALDAVRHPQIVSVRLEKNRGISGATNAAIDEARGDYIVFLDHDDELTENCLYELAMCVERDNPDFIYSDEDKIDSTGHFTQPFFKPDWSPDTMMSTMFTCHVSCARRSLVLELGG